MSKHLGIILLLIVFFSLVFFSCENSPKERTIANSQKSGDNYSTRDTIFNTNPENVLKDFNTWWSYYYSKTNLAESFIGYNDSAKAITREEFLKLLQSGNYAPIKTMIKDGVAEYKLYRLGNNRTDIANIIKQETGKVLFNFYQEGKPLPVFRFEDLNGNIYTPENTKGKIIVLKCWFIHCGACVAEFPELNEIVQQYKDRKDILFISLASDEKELLVNFLKTKKFDYETVPNQRNYMTEELKVSQYPTHILVGKDGTIKIIVGKAVNFIQTLRNEAERK